MTEIVDITDANVDIVEALRRRAVEEISIESCHVKQLLARKVAPIAPLEVLLLAHMLSELLLVFLLRGQWDGCLTSFRLDCAWSLGSCLRSCLARCCQRGHA